MPRGGVVLRNTSDVRSHMEIRVDYSVARGDSLWQCTTTLWLVVYDSLYQKVVKVKHL